ncbi:uncharacterized protein snap34 [Haematococcus lacustris]|uniref:Uncharacterized protein snap34 n=1 Tax=Haematococcus lacustris TaxID=44745 RepID=A0A6A0AD88_HAELA|nr:uncharacterized protein snap34 [Haematococcus lacustris]
MREAKVLGYQLKEEDAIRNELFAGSVDPRTPVKNERTVDQLVSEASTTHRETTQTAQRALRVIEQSKQVQANTMQELDKQGKQLGNMKSKLHKINEDLTYKADPEAQRRRDWQARVDKGKTEAKDKALAEESASAKTATGPPGSSAGQQDVEASGSSSSSAPSPHYRDPDIKLPAQYASQELKLHTETRKQNELLDQIHVGLGDLLNGAKQIGEEIGTQTRALDKVQNRAENTTGRIHEMNNKSQLRDFKVDKDKKSVNKMKIGGAILKAKDVLKFK